MPTNSSTETIKQRLQEMVDEGSAIQRTGDGGFYADSAPMSAWRTRSIAFLQRTLGPTDAYTTSFIKETEKSWAADRDKGVAILANLRADIDQGYLESYYLGIAGEVLADLFDLGSWSLSEGSKEAPAILAGAGLEAGLRRVATARSVDIHRARGIDDINEALAKFGVYGSVRRSQVDSWRVLRNHAIHGEHDAYSDADVRLMLDGVRALLAEELR